jgi:hypothetical protein
MVTLDWTTARHDGVTLVTAQLGDIHEPTRVTVRNRLDGPVWPPRREGLPEDGWTESGFRGVVTSGSHALGYASPAEPVDPPVALATAEPAPNAAPVGEATDDPAAVVRELGDPSPPSDAVPVDGTRGTDEVRDPRASSGTAAVQESEPTADSGPSTGDADSHISALPDAVGPWLAEMARRVDRAEALAEADTVPAATTAVRDAGGLAGVRDIAGPSDEKRLRVVARRARRLAERRAAADVPVETLAALA